MFSFTIFIYLCHNTIDSFIMNYLSISKVIVYLLVPLSSRLNLGSIIKDSICKVVISQ
jgi:hypothetical protein